MRNTNKKGFTIVELVVVVAVIAILAAVLIPTFSGIIAKANLSADQKAVSTMNTAIAMEGAETLEEAMAALEKHNINAEKLIPVSKGYSFIWNDDTNKIELVEGRVDESVNEAKKNIAITVNSADALADAIADDLKYIKLEADVVLEEKITVPANASTTLDLAGKDFDASALSGRPFEMSDGSSIIINATDSDIKSGRYGLVNISNDVSASVTINGGNVTGSLDNGSFFKVVGGDADKVSITLNNVNITDNANTATTGNTEQLNRIVNANAFYGELTLVVKGGTYTALAGFTGGGENSKFNFEGVTFNTKGLATEISRTATFNNCIFNVGDVSICTVPAAAVVVSYGGVATVTGCTITSNKYSYLVLNTGGEIKYSNTTVNKGSEYMLPLNDGVTGSITQQ